MSRKTLASLTLILALAACSKAGPATDALANQPLLITPQDLVTVQGGTLTAGPSITGSIQPQRPADLLAEVCAVVLQVHKDNGDQVRRGELVREGDKPASLDWAEKAWEQSKGPATRLQWGSSYVKRLIAWNDKGQHAAIAKKLTAQLDAGCAKLAPQDETRAACFGVFKPRVGGLKA